jgi:Xylose isomerase-like TIM barrel
MHTTRREFLQTAVAAGATAVAASGTSAAAQTPPHRIRRGVATYCYQEEVFVRQMTVEDILKEMSDIGAYGLEVLPEMLVPGFPNPSDAWVDQWKGWLAKYKIEPACYTQFVDTMRTRSRYHTVEQGVQTMLRDIRLAKRLGIPRIRGLMGTPVPVLEALLPHLDDHGVWVGVELHAPLKLKSPLMDRLLKIADKSSMFGFVPDFGIFQNKPNPYLRDRLIRQGRVTKETALYVDDAWLNRVAKETALERVRTMSGGPGAEGYVNTVYGITTQDPRDLLPFMAKCRHIHGKTWGLTEDCVDPAIDITEVIPTLIRGGYDGVIATEYEGQRMMQDVEPFSEVEMVRRHQVLLRRLLGEIEA